MQFRWSPSRIYYGWWVVAAFFLISGYVNGIVLYGFTAIIDPVVEDFGWSYAIVSVASSLRGLETGLLTPVVGFLADRWSSRRLVFLGAFIVGLGLVLFSRINSLWSFYAVFVILSIGVSSSSVVLATSIAAEWFKKNLSFATGVIICGSSLGGVLVPLVTLAIDSFGWRIAMLEFGIGALVVLLPLSLVVRQGPVKRGRSLEVEEGELPAKPESQVGAGVNEKGVGAKKALRSRAFWYISLAITFHALACISVLVHVMPYLGSIGIERSTASLVASGIPLVAIAGRISFGWLGDRYDNRRMAILCLILTLIGMLMFNYVSSIGAWILVPYLIIFGLGLGGFIPLIPALVRQYFGLKWLGSILGMAMGIMMVGSMVGPPLAGWVFDTYGSYEYAWLGLTGGTFIGLMIIVLLPASGSVEPTQGKI